MNQRAACGLAGILIMTLFTALFYIAAAMTGLSAIMVVVTQNIVRAAACIFCSRPTSLALRN
jgi:hypothetical protein